MVNSAGDPPAHILDQAGPISKGKTRPCDLRHLGNGELALDGLESLVYVRVQTWRSPNVPSAWRTDSRGHAFQGVPEPCPKVRHAPRAARGSTHWGEGRFRGHTAGVDDRCGKTCRRDPFGG